MAAEAPTRALAPRISEPPDELASWRKQCWEEVNVGYNEHYRKGTLLHNHIQELPLEVGSDALDKLTRLAIIAFGSGSEKGGRRYRGAGLAP